jgi:arginyl-tRNA synthetase
MSVIEQVKQALTAEIRRAILAAELVEEAQLPEIILETPREKAHGDYSTNAAMQLTRIAKQNPRQIAERIVGQIRREAVFVDRIEIAGPGFINFYMDKSFLYRIVGQIMQAGDDYGRVQIGNGKKVQVEFVSANPTGSLHLGHARGAAFGDSLCNLLSFAGYDVTREYYINDAGNQIMNLAKSIDARYKEALGLPAEMPEDGYYGEDIIEFARRLVERDGDKYISWPEEERLRFFRAYGLEQELAKIKRDLERFRVTFDVWTSETSLYESGAVEATLRELKDRGQTYEADGAVWLRTTPYGDDKDRVLVKNDGTYTYLTPDIAYHKSKYLRGFDQLINIWGADHHGYIARIKAAMEALGHPPEKLTVLITQMVSLYQGGEKVKMSKRTGKAVTMEDLMDEVGVDAIRYFFTMRSIDSHLDFDMDLAVSQSNENPVYYVQYAHARICSVYRQAEEQGIVCPPLDRIDLGKLRSEAEFDLLRKLGELPHEVREAAEHYAPHRLIRYIYELASMFHSYYKAERFITDDLEQTYARLALAGCVRIVLRNVLRLIGVSAPERM